MKRHFLPKNNRIPVLFFYSLFLPLSLALSQPHPSLLAIGFSYRNNWATALCVLSLDVCVGLCDLWSLNATVHLSTCIIKGSNGPFINCLFTSSLFLSFQLSVSFSVSQCLFVPILPSSLPASLLSRYLPRVYFCFCSYLSSTLATLGLFCLLCLFVYGWSGESEWSKSEEREKNKRS